MEEFRPFVDGIKGLNKNEIYQDIEQTKEELGKKLKETGSRQNEIEDKILSFQQKIDLMVAENTKKL